MHLLMIIAALGLAWLLRLAWQPSTGNWSQRWQRALFFFLLPPLLLLMTAVAVLYMGPTGNMMGLHNSWLSYSLVLTGVGISLGLCLKLALAGWQSLHQVRTYPRIELGNRQQAIGLDSFFSVVAGGKRPQLEDSSVTARLLENPTLFIAQIGFWQPELMVSQGLLQKLEPEHLEAVLAHEQAHYHYRDTFWFFWLGWIRCCSAWLPNTEALWQELLLLREIRADGWAAQRVDPLLLAESLLMVVSASVMASENFCAAFNCAVYRNRLHERIDALLGEVDDVTPSNIWTWSWVTLALLPMATVPFHG